MIRTTTEDVFLPDAALGRLITYDTHANNICIVRAWGSADVSQKTISSREFASDPLAVKRWVGSSDVIVTNRGRPELALLTYERYQWLVAALPPTALEALGDSEAAEVEFDPPKLRDLPRHDGQL